MRIGLNDYEHTANPELWVQPVDGQGTLAFKVSAAAARVASPCRTAGRLLGVDWLMI